MRWEADQTRSGKHYQPLSLLTTLPQELNRDPVSPMPCLSARGYAHASWVD